ncbi:uncharacterized protein LOC143024317 [Oratosquilla oratoria]|uniref:uncharacterized protein LOC143024317 n=1 Tax=Oratosquilla oratoria TaxID=337810 RepID=UPI003F7772C3
MVWLDIAPPDEGAEAPVARTRSDDDPNTRGAAPSVTASASRPSVDRGRSASIDVMQFSSNSSCCSSSSHNLTEAAALKRGRPRSSSTFSASSSSETVAEADEDTGRTRTFSSNASSGRRRGSKGHKKRWHHCVVAGGLFPAFKVT